MSHPALVPPTPRPALTKPFELSTAFQQTVVGLIEKYRIPGLSISVIRKVEDEWVQGVSTWGIRDKIGSPWEADSKHAIASCSKIFAAASVGILIERGAVLPNGMKLTWNTKIKEVLPDWKMMDKVTEENADIEDALSGNNAAWGRKGEIAQSIVYRMRYHKPAAPFRKAFIYCNDNYTLAGEFIATIAGVPYTQFVENNILNPLGMLDSQYDHEDALASGRRVEGFTHYEYDGEQRRAALEKGEWSQNCVGRVGETKFWDSQDGLYFAAAGGLWTTATDILKWLKEMLEPKLFAKSIIDDISRPRVAWGESDSPHPSLSARYYGLGQVTTYYRGHRIIGHGGGLPGHHSFVLRLPDDNIGFAIFCNDDTFGSQLNEALSMMLIDDLLKIEERVDWEEVYMLKEMRKAPDRSLSPEFPSSAVDITGTYNNGAYGTLIVRRITEHPMGETLANLLKEYPGNTIPIQHKAQLYIGDLDHKLAGKLLLSPFSGQTFTRAFVEAEKLQSLIKGDEREHVGSVYSAGKCVVTKDGIGMFEDFWGQGGAIGGLKIRQCVEENVEEMAEVWFEKVV